MSIRWLRARVRVRVRVSLTLTLTLTLSIRWLRVRVRVRVRVRLPNLEHQVAARVRPAVAGGRALLGLSEPEDRAEGLYEGEGRGQAG